MKRIFLLIGFMLSCMAVVGCQNNFNNKATERIKPQSHDNDIEHDQLNTNTRELPELPTEPTTECLIFNAVFDYVKHNVEFPDLGESKILTVHYPDGLECKLRNFYGKVTDNVEEGQDCLDYIAFEKLVFTSDDTVVVDITMSSCVLAQSGYAVTVQKKGSRTWHVIEIKGTWMS